MRDRTRFFGIAFVTTIALTVSPPFSQAQTQGRIPQQIVINGQMVSGAYVTSAGGQMQSFTCPSPQQYTTADGSSQGWACYEQTTGVWLLNAVPPAPTQTAPAPTPVPSPAPAPQVVVPEQPPVWYPRMPPAVVYQPPPAVVYQQPAVIYPQPTTVIVSQPAPPAVIYAPPPPPVVVAPAYPSSVVLGRAAIEAAGRIASAVILNSGHTREYYYYDYGHPGRGRGRR